PAARQRGRRHRRPGRGVPAADPSARPGGDRMTTRTASTTRPTPGRARPGRTLLATTGRILRQIRHDRRSIALILVVPVVLLTLVYYMFEHQPEVFQRVGLSMLGVFPLVIMFLLTSIAMLRE